MPVVTPCSISGNGATVYFERPFEPYPPPAVQWPDRVQSEHQMRPGLDGDEPVGGDLVTQDFGVPRGSGIIEFNVPFITKEMRDDLNTIYQTPPGDNVTVFLTDDSTSYTCVFLSCQMPPRTSRFGQYTASLRFRVVQTS